MYHSAHFTQGDELRFSFYRESTVSTLHSDITQSNLHGSVNAVRYVGGVMWLIFLIRHLYLIGVCGYVRIKEQRA